MKSTLRCLLLSVLIAVAANSAARATPLLVNGGFETTNSGPGQFTIVTVAPGWTANGYNFIFGPGSADTTGSKAAHGTLRLWGPNNGSANGLPSTSPAGGNFVGADGAFQVGPIQQTISGLVPNQRYNVSFWWAGAQQYGFDGVSTEQWVVSLGGQTLQTAIVSVSNHGFTGWRYQGFTFTADNTSDVLSFLAAGSPQGEPPFLLLDGVTIPEPGSFAVLAVALVTIGSIGRRRRGAGAMA